jgi:DNA-3-methyladenine glycosylase
VTGRRLPRSFYARAADLVAPDLLGHRLVRRSSNGLRLAARIVEAEAYAPDDPASHAFRGQTPRNSCMFGEAGHLYVYFTYGMHFCMNAVTGRIGTGSAVLLRAGEPVEGIEAMAANRGRDGLLELCSGPAKWTQAFGVGRDLNCADLVDGEDIWIERGSRPGEVAVGPRVGVTSGAEVDWRFMVAGDPFVSRKRGGRA